MTNGFAKISKSALKFLEPLSLEKTCETVVREGIAIVKASFGSILLLEGTEFKRVFSTLPEKTLSIIQKKGVRKRGFTYQAFKKNEIIVKYKDIFARHHPEIAKLGVKTDIFVPLSHKNKAIGTLILNFEERKKLTKDDRDLLKLLSALASLTILKSKLYEETKEALETRNLFISTAAHEIRTPVATIFGYTQLLLNNLKSGMKIKSEWIDSIHGECYRLKDLINDLLVASHINSNYLRYNFRECDLKEIIELSVNNFKLSHPDRQLITKNNLSDKEDVIVGDHDRLIQTLNNLLENAAKFSIPDTIITLELKKDDSDLIVAIKDQGRGISKKDLPQIFERYFKGSNTKHEGLGLGLFLVRSIIEHHRGSIEIKSKLNKGTLVEIRLPKRKRGVKI